MFTSSPALAGLFFVRVEAKRHSRADEGLTMTNDQTGLRKRWKDYHKTNSALALGWFAAGMPHGQLSGLPFPPELRGLRCGAKTRAGTPCKRRDLYASGRCRLHGGLSTGPKRNLTRALVEC